MTKIGKGVKVYKRHRHNEVRGIELKTKEEAQDFEKKKVASQNGISVDSYFENIQRAVREEEARKAGLTIVKGA
jgi:hypothetical protein